MRRVRVPDLQDPTLRYLRATKAKSGEGVNERTARGIHADHATSQGWIESAACNGHDTTLFFPEDLPTRSREDRDRAQRIVRETLRLCAECPVRVECLEYGLEDEYGIFGGTTAEQRHTIRINRSKNRKGRI